MKVYIILIGDHGLHPDIKVGAVYQTMQEACEEVYRLNAANTHTDAWWIVRHLERKKT